MTIQQDIFKNRLLGVLLFITLLLVALQHYGPEKRLLIGKDVGLDIITIDDRDNQGASISSLTRDGDRLILDCEIIPSAFQWPYCEVSFNLTRTDGTGIDLSGYHAVQLAAKYSTPQDFGIRFQLINFNADYANKHDHNSLKYNAIELFDTHERYPQVVQLSQMQVPTWWLSQGKRAPEYWGPEFNDVRGLQIATGEQVKPGKYQMIIEQVELRGKYLDDNQLYLGLLCVWMLLALVYFFTLLHKTQQELTLHKQRQLQLEALNRLLNLEQKKLEERLARDPLTGVLNRDGIAQVFQQQWDSDAAPPLSLIFIDIDHFKKINDNHGHNRGDWVLQIFAKLLMENTRTHDLLARWGGEEFVLACPDTPLDNAVGLAEKLRRCIEQQDWPEQLNVTASFGVAQMAPGESPTDFIARADKALYSAKAQGRNCVCSSLMAETATLEAKAA